MFNQNPDVPRGIHPNGDPVVWLPRGGVVFYQPPPPPSGIVLGRHGALPGHVGIAEVVQRQWLRDEDCQISVGGAISHLPLGSKPGYLRVSSPVGTDSL